MTYVSSHPVWCVVVEAHNAEDCRAYDDTARCPKCGSLYTVRKDGRLRKHTRLERNTWSRSHSVPCEGSGEFPG